MVLRRAVALMLVFQLASPGRATDSVSSPIGLGRRAAPPRTGALLPLTRVKGPPTSVNDLRGGKNGMAFPIAPTILQLALVGTALTLARWSSTAASSGTTEPSGFNLLAGLTFSLLALAGNTGVTVLRKVLSQQPGVTPAVQVGLAAGIQSCGALAVLATRGRLSVPPKVFWLAALFSSLGNAVVKTLETKAFAESLTLCAPFLAFDPVMQFLVGVTVVPMLCRTFGVGCSELTSSSRIPPHHVLSVLSIAVGAFVLGSRGKVEGDTSGVKYLGPLPVGSWLILLNCVIYGFTFRLDKAAVLSGGVALYYCYGRGLMAVMSLLGTWDRRSSNASALAPFRKPRPALLLLAICAADAAYMLSLYRAVALISPVYVSAIKRGGGVLVTALMGALCFGEPVRGREVPIATIFTGVVLLCLAR